MQCKSTLAWVRPMVPNIYACRPASPDCAGRKGGKLEIFSFNSSSKASLVEANHLQPVLSTTLQVKTRGIQLSGIAHPIRSCKVDQHRRRGKPSARAKPRDGHHDVSSHFIVAQRGLELRTRVIISVICYRFFQD